MKEPEEKPGEQARDQVTLVRPEAPAVGRKDIEADWTEARRRGWWEKHRPAAATA